MKTIHSIETKDGFKITLNCFVPDSRNIKAGVLICAATAVKQEYYAAFATYLCEKGFVVITFDYRGIGQSAHTYPDDPRLTMRAWGEQDLTSVINWADESFPLIEWHCVCHSVGGQLIGLAENNYKLNSVYCVASQNGYWGHWKKTARLKMFMNWYIVLPLLAKFWGHIPGFLLGGESLPGTIAKEWAWWGRNKQYIVDEYGQPIRQYFSGVSCKMRFLVIDDDNYFAPEEAVLALKTFYTEADTETEYVISRTIDSKPIGHFGFFKQRYRHILWSGYLNWLYHQLIRTKYTKMSSVDLDSLMVFDKNNPRDPSPS